MDCILPISYWYRTFLSTYLLIYFSEFIENNKSFGASPLTLVDESDEVRRV